MKTKLPTINQIRKILRDNNVDFFIDDKNFPLLKIRVYVDEGKEN